MKFKVFLFVIVFYSGLNAIAQNSPSKFDETIKSRVRVIVDNDFGGDPDGLFQLVQQILSPSAEIRAIIGSQHYKNGFYGSPGNASYACTQVNELLDVMQLTGKLPVYEGANSGLTNISTPIESDGAKAIVKEAMREDNKKMPLFVICGAGLTNIASAYLMEPKIADRIILIWIGGPEYAGLAIPPPRANKVEYNLGIDIKASQVLFNSSTIPIWQVPRDAYRQALFSYTELVYKVKSKGSVGYFLMQKLEDLMKRANRSLGETYVLGDSPLVLLTALQSSWETDPSSSIYVVKPAPIIKDSGLYDEKPDGRKIRVYTSLDTRLMFEDFVAKLALFGTEKH
jgi:purine nucleosidase